MTGKTKQIVISRVVSHNFIMDIVAKTQNLVGVNLSGYEKMINKGTYQINQEIKSNGIILKWFRYEITQLTNGAVAIMLYGETE